VKIAVSTAASEVAPNASEAADGDEYDNATANGLYYKEWLEAHGAEVYLIPIDVNPGEDYPGDPYSADNAFDPAVAAEIRSSDVVYFGGGDQTNYVRSLFECDPSDPAAAAYAYTSCTDTPAMAAIREVVEGGGVSAGTSAGLAIQQGADMISGGEPYESWRDGAVPGWYDGADPDHGNALTYIPAGGLGFFTEGTLDSHFARRDRQPRVVRLAIQTGHDLAFGVEEKTALVVDRANRTGEVIGDLGVTMLDVSNATSDGQNVAGVRYSYFMQGSRIDFSTGEITLAEASTTAAGTGALPAPEEDIWKSGECDSDPYIFGALTLAQEFVKSSAARASGDSCDAASEQPRFRTTYNRLTTTEWSADGSFLNLGMTVSGVPSFEATASVSAPSTSTSMPVGTESSIAIRVTNTGTTSLTGFSVNGGTPDTSVIGPGGSITLIAAHTVGMGTYTYDWAITATAVDAQGTDLSIDTPAGSASLVLTGTENNTNGGGGSNGNGGGSSNGGNDGNGGTVSDKQKGADLARTGSTEPVAPLLAASLALVAGSLLLLRSRRRTN
jgi:cyanophycinase